MFGLCDECEGANCTRCEPEVWGGFTAEMRRYLYRNVACEARKASDIARHIPQIPGWS